MLQEITSKTDPLVYSLIRDQNYPVLFQIMKDCEQTKGLSVYDHCQQVAFYFKDLYAFFHFDYSLSSWKVPEWFIKYKDQLKAELLPLGLILSYLQMHDCGKSFSKINDEEGKFHFINHSQKSAEIFLKYSGPTKDNLQVAKLISMDMDIHKLKAEGIPEFIKHKECITLLLAGLSEIHANAQMFGGINSDSFKMKWKQIDKRGKAICKLLFKKGENNVN